MFLLYFLNILCEHKSRLSWREEILQTQNLWIVVWIKWQTNVKKKTVLKD